MKVLRIFALFLVWVGFAVLAATAYAQNPPFQNPSLDSNCYFPQIGVPGEIDTIYGSYSGEGLGAYIHNLGPKADGSFGNMLLGNSNGLGELAPTGPNFDLHDLHAISEGLGISDAETPNLRFGHFRDQYHLDIFDQATWVIYWADDNGNYSGNRYTQLWSNIYGAQGFVRDLSVFTNSYLAHLTNDTVDDIIVGFWTDDYPNKSNDSLYLALFKGGIKLYRDTLAYEDTSIVMPPPFVNDYHSTLQGDFCGTGRSDLIISDDNHNLFFYKNDRPFSLANLLHAMLFDTIWPNSPIGAGISNSSLVMHALPKKKGDNSCDFVDWIPTHGDSGIYFFRGGPDFGSHRITIDSAAFVITKPQLGYAEWPVALYNYGDMTGTGNNVLYTFGWQTGYGWQNYYLTGQALDNKIDMYYADNNGTVVLGDTLTANGDSLEDVLAGNSNYNTLWLLYGSKQIPVHLDSLFADVKGIPQQDGAGVSFMPNPVTAGWSVATIVWPVSENGEYSIYDMLGRMCDHGPIQLYGGAEEQRIYFSGLPAGVYLYTITGAHDAASAKIVKLGAASGSSSPQPSIIQQMKNARDQRIPAGIIR